MPSILCLPMALAIGFFLILHPADASGSDRVHLVRKGDPVRIGIVAYRPKPIIAKNWAPLESELERRIPERDFEILPLDMTELEAAVQSESVDFIVTQPAHYIALSKTHPLSSPLATVINDDHNQAASVFGGVIFVKSGAATRSLSDLRGKTIAALGSESFAGYQVQAYELKKIGISLPADANMLFTKAPQDQAVFAVLEGRADAGFVRTGVLESLAAEGKIRLSDVRIINSQASPRLPLTLSTPLYPEFPFVALKGADDSLARRVTAALLLLGEDASTAKSIGISGFAAPADYSEVEALLRDMRLPPFEAPSLVPLADVWGQYRTLIVSAGFLTALSLLLAILVIISRFKLKAERDRATSGLRALQASETRTRAIVSSIPDMVWMKGPDGKYSYINQAFADFCEKSEQDILGRGDHDVLPKTAENAWHAETQEFPKDPDQWARAGGPILVKGSPRFFSITRTPVLLSGELLGVMGIAQDITEQREHEESQRLIAKVFESAQEAIMITDAERTIIQVNNAFERSSGYSAAEALGQKASLLRADRHTQAFYSDLWDSIRVTGHWSGEMWNRRKDGSEFPTLKTISALKGPSGSITHYVSIFTDISSIKAHEAQLERVAHFDPLTNLPNRRLLGDRLRMAISRAEREHSLLAVCCVDLDGFKPINDELGHAAGDRVLCEISRRIESSCRETDTVARLGGDEFAILLSSLSCRDEADKTLGRILDNIRQPLHLDGLTRSVSASIGATYYPFDQIDDGDTLLRHADIAMYEAKSSGKNRFCVFDAEIERKEQSQAEAVRRLWVALERGEFALHYQPKVRLLNGEIAGAEALIRWIHPERGIVPPLDFLPLLHGSQLTLRVGEWVIDEALSQASQWISEGIPFGSISVNIDAEHLLSPDFSERLRQALQRRPEVHPSMLEIEILETAALDDMARANAALAECLRLGVSFALDDFGTGYSSIDYFRRLPVGCLKIDRSFVRDMLEDPEDLSIVKSVIGLARAFSRPVVAEGVETIAHASLLLSLGCEIAQGYGIARPLPKDAFAAWALGWDPRKGAASFGATERVSGLVLTESDPLSPLSPAALSAAAASHAAWISSVDEFVLGKTTQPPQMDHTRCPLGRWLQGPVLSDAANFDAISEIADFHENAHSIAETLSQLVFDGRLSEAQARLFELHAARDRLLSSIEALRDRTTRSK